MRRDRLHMQSPKRKRCVHHWTCYQIWWLPFDSVSCCSCCDVIQDATSFVQSRHLCDASQEIKVTITSLEEIFWIVNECENKHRICNQESWFHLHFMPVLSLVNELLDRWSSCNSAVQGCSMICAVLFPMLAFTATLAAFVLQDRKFSCHGLLSCCQCNVFSWFALWIHRWCSLLSQHRLEHNSQYTSKDKHDLRQTFA